MIAKKHKTNDGRFVLALCDDELVGKKISGKEAVLDLTSDFYKGEKLSDEKLKKCVEDAYIINCVGKKSIKFLIALKVLEEKNVGYVNKTPHAQIIQIKEEG